MKRYTNWLMGWGLVAFLAAGAGCVKQQHVEMQIQADGTTTLTMRAVMDRAYIEQMLSWQDQAEGFGPGGGDVWDDEYWDRRFGQHLEDEFEEGEESGAEGEAEAASDAEGAAAETEPPADAEAAEAEDTDPAGDDADPDASLEQKLRRMFTEQMSTASPLSGIDGIEMDLTDVAVAEDDVEITATVTAATLDALVTASPHLLDDFGVQGIRLEETDGGHLRVTLMAVDDPARKAQAQQVRQYLKNSQITGSFTVSLPGPIVSSPLPETEGDTTSFAFDTSDDEQLESLVALFGDDMVIEAEPGGLDLSALPLEPDPTAALAVAFGDESGYAALPLEDADGEFTAEPLMVTQKTVHYYAGADELVASQPFVFSEAVNQCQVQARLYAPRGRYVLSLQSAVAKRAEDEQGRLVEPMSDPHGMMMHHRGMWGGDEPAISADMTLSLELPPPDAQALEMIEGEAVVVTFEGWNELSLNPAEPDPENAIDLEGVLSGAKLIIRNVKHVSSDEEHGGQLQGAAQVEIIGPPEVAQLDVQFRGGDDRMHVNSYTAEDATREHAGQTQRRAIVQYNMWAHDGPPKEKPHLVVRLPRGVKRVKVPFTLEAVDLF